MRDYAAHLFLPQGGMGCLLGRSYREVLAYQYTRYGPELNWHPRQEIMTLILAKKGIEIAGYDEQELKDDVIAQSSVPRCAPSRGHGAGTR